MQKIIPKNRKLTAEPKFVKQNVFHIQFQYINITNVIFKSKHYVGNPMFEVPKKITISSNNHIF